MNKKIIWITIIGISLLILGYILYTLLQTENKKVGYTKNITESNFELSYTYQGENSWTYSIDGTLPTPCYAVNTTAEVAESYPEQVTIRVSVQEQPTEGVCTTVIQEYSYSGIFQASERANVTLRVE